MSQVQAHDLRGRVARAQIRLEAGQELAKCARGGVEIAGAAALGGQPGAGDEVRGAGG